MTFMRGEKLRIKQGVTREMCDRSAIPYELAGMECTHLRGSNEFDDREAVEIDGSSWRIHKECLEYFIMPCMFKKEV